MPTERIYYHDAYAARFNARVVEASGNRIYLDRTVFYPTSGGQPNDLGELNGVRVVDVVDEDHRIAHVLDGTLGSAEVEGSIDWPRRWDHMQQHSGQHLLSATLEHHFGLRTVSFHLGAEAATIDLETAAISPEQLAEAERLANAIMQENRALGVSYESAVDAGGLRKASERTGTLRIVTIADCDRSACGGTHVRATGEIGAILLGKTEKIRNTVRLEFACGMRAVARARRDFDALSAAARAFSAPLAQVPSLVTAQMERLADSEKARAKLEMALAVEAGRALYRATGVTARGLSLVVERTPAIDETVRGKAQGFVEGSKGVYLALCEAGPSYLLAASADAGVHAGQWMQPFLSAGKGKGGGSAALAQGRAATAETLSELEAAARAAF